MQISALESIPDDNYGYYGNFNNYSVHCSIEIHLIRDIQINYIKARTYSIDLSWLGLQYLYETLMQNLMQVCTVSSHKQMSRAVATALRALVQNLGALIHD